MNTPIYYFKGEFYEKNIVAIADGSNDTVCRFL